MDFLRNKAFYLMSHMPSKLRFLVLFGIISFTALYLLQIASPIRINTDSYRLLSMAINFNLGKGFTVDGHLDQYPLGYPFLVAKMLDASIARSWTLVFINIVSLFAGLGLFVRLFLDGYTALFKWVLFLMSMCSWVFIKHVTLATTDLLYLLISIVALYCLVRYLRIKNYKKWFWLALAFVLSLASIKIRTVGICLVATLPIVLIAHSDFSVGLAYLRRELKLLMVMFLAFFVIGTMGLFFVSKTEWFVAQFVSKQGYFQSMLSIFSEQGVISFLMTNAQNRMIEYGEITLNIPFLKFVDWRWLFSIFGFFTFAASIWGAFLALKNTITFPLSVYFLFYMGLLFVWPFYDPRFLMPVIPAIFLFAYLPILTIIKRFGNPFRVFFSYCVAFVFLGFVALVFSSKITLSGNNIGECYGDETNKMSCRYFYKKNAFIDKSKVNPGHLQILENLSGMNH